MPLCTCKYLGAGTDPKCRNCRPASDRLSPALVSLVTDSAVECLETDVREFLDAVATVRLNPDQQQRVRDCIDSLTDAVIVQVARDISVES